MMDERKSTRSQGSARASRLGSAGSVAMTPPQSPAVNRIPSAYLLKEIDNPPNPTKWQKDHEQYTFQQLHYQREAKKQNTKLSKEKAQKLARKIPADILAKEWMKDHQITLDTRAYLVENILPTLILGLEKLLMEADKRELASNANFDSNFNPVNYLAQYLMRNNPRYSNFSEASPYIKSLREVAEKLKQQIFQLEDNKLARIKNEARQKREEREKAILYQKQERMRRAKLLTEQFLDWTKNPEGRVEETLVYSALKSFEDMIEYLPPELQAAGKLSKPFDQNENRNDCLTVKDFVEVISNSVEEFSATLFDQFITHLRRCAKAYHAEVQREQRKTTLTNLFVLCDNTGVGVLNRHRVLSLFESFYDKQEEKTKLPSGLQNPRKWPLVDVDEADSDFSDDEDNENLQKIKSESSITRQTIEESTSLPMADIKEPDAEESGETSKDSLQTRPDSADEKHESEEAEKADENANENVDENTQEKMDELSEKQKIKDSELIHQTESSDAVKSSAPLNVMKSDEKTNDEQAGNMPQPESASQVDDLYGSTSEASKLSIDIKSIHSLLALLGGQSHLPLTSDQAKQQLARTGVSFAQGTNLGLNRERTTLETRGTGSQSQMSAFDENTLNVYQFVQITEKFLGDNPALEIFQTLCRYMRDGYIETEEEKMTRLMKAHKEAQVGKQKVRIDGLFEKWDNEGSGYLELEEIETIAHKYKDGLERQAINRAKHKFLTTVKQRIGHSDSRVIRSEFRELIYFICEELPGEAAFDYFMDFLETCVERTYAEKIRGEARKKWLQQIISSAEVSAASLETVFRSIFQALYRDAETHGSGKIISSNIALLERNSKYPERGPFQLRYIASTSDDSSFMLNQILYKDMKGISFACCDTGKPLHVPRVNNHGNIHFWNPDRPEEDRDGSFVVIPLKDKMKRVFGILGIDTMRDLRAKSIFITHEIQFYQGVAKAFSIAYHNVDMKRKTLRITESAISWILRRSESVFEINVYLVEPDGKNEDYVLRRMMLAHGDKAEVKIFDAPSRLERKENLFRDYLFKCVDNSETVTADAYGQRHLAFPLRGSDGRAVAVIDISTGETKVIPKHEKKEMLKILKLVQRAQREITKERTEGQKTVVLEAEKENEDVRVEIMFDRLMLMDLRHKVAKLDARAYAELKSYAVPPKVIHNILKSTLSLFYPEKASKNAFDDWTTCKMDDMLAVSDCEITAGDNRSRRCRLHSSDNCSRLINSDLNNKIANFDPTSEGSELIPTEVISAPLSDIPHGMVTKHGSVPAEYLYNWIFVCLSLIQHIKRMRVSQNTQEEVKSMLPTGMTPDLAALADDED